MNSLGAEVRLFWGAAEPWVRRLPTRSAVTIGRPSLGLASDAARWLPRTLVTLDRYERGWVARLGGRGRVELSGALVVGQAAFAQRAEVLLGRGWWSLSWPGLDQQCRLDLDILPVERLRSNAPWVLSDAAPRVMPLTAPALGRDQFSPRERHWLAVCFRHLLEDEPPPANPSAEAAKILAPGDGGARTVHNFLHHQRRRVNRARGQEAQIATTADFGHYLVEVAQVVDRADLQP